MTRFRFEVVPRRPYSLVRTGARLAWFEERVDRFEDGVYRRLLFDDDNALLMEVSQRGAPSRAVLEVRLTGDGARRVAAREASLRILDRVLGVNVDLRPFYRQFRDDAILGPVLPRHRGLRVAGRACVWDTLLQIVLSQQVTLSLAHGILSELARVYGRRRRIEGRTYYGYPTPDRFRRLTEAELRSHRLSGAKARTLIGLATAFDDGAISDEELNRLEDEAAIERLMEFKGVGRWTAEFTLLRGLGRMDVFPGGDLGVVKHLATRLLGRDAPAPEEEMREFAEGWRPYRGLALIYAYAELSS